MAQTALTVVGYAVGSYFGYPQLGAMVGAYVGGLVAAEDYKGPRLNDSRVQISSYGAMLALPYGGVRLAGNIIWSTPLQETENEESAKGGPTSTTYTYSVSCAVAIAGRTIGGVRKIWADAKLIYDISGEDNGLGAAASSAFDPYMVVYLGTEDQMPDPTIEAVEGVGNVEAFRGAAYVVFTDIPLGDYGNRIPNFSFEVTDKTPQPATIEDYAPLRVYGWGGGPPVHSRGDTEFTSYLGGSGTDFATMAQYNATQAFNNGVDSAFASTNYIGVYHTSNDPNLNIYSGGGLAGDDESRGSPETVTYRLAAIDQSFTERTYVNDFNHTLSFDIGEPMYLYYEGLGEWIGIRQVSTDPQPPSQSYNGTLSSGPISPYPTLSVVFGNKVLTMSGRRVPAVPPPTCSPGDPCVDGGIAEIPGQPDFCVSCEGAISVNYTWIKVVGTAKQLCAVEYRDDVLYQNALGPVLLPGHPNYDNAAFWAEQAADAIAAGLMAGDVATPVNVASYAQAVPPNMFTVDAGDMILGDIVEELCVAAGLEASQVDVTQLDDVVLGYRVARQMPARQAIQPLRQAYWFDAVESGRKIVFVKRGQDVAVTITADELGAAEDREGEARVQRQRAQETELPATIAVAYECREADYQVGVQRARRSTTGSRLDVSAEIPVVLTDQHAAEIADVLLYDAWAGRVKTMWNTNRSFARSEPTDLWLIDDGERQYTVRAIEKSEEGGIIRWAGVDEDQGAYSPNSTAQPTAGGGSVVRFDGPMKVMLLDIPLLRDADNGASFLAAGTGFIRPFRGGQLFRSVDGSDYASIREIRQEATIGYANTALGDYAGGNTVDEVNSVDVRMHAGTLASIARPALLNAGNAALLGDELIHFQRAVLVDTGTYRLTGLLRGRRGTEQHMGSHAISERFVLLNPANIYRVTQDLSDVDVEAQYKGVAYGTNLASAVEQDFTYTGANLKPLSPVHLAAVPLAGGGYQVQWQRRTRVGGAWRDLLDASLGEVTEEYDVVVTDADGDVTFVRRVTEKTVNLSSVAPGTELFVSAYGLTEVGTDEFVGLFDDSSPPGQSIRRYDGDGAYLGGMAVGASSPRATALVGNVDDIYVAVIDGSNPSFVYRIARTAITVGAALAVQATYVSAAADTQGLAFDGTYIWVAESYSARIRRLDASTLAVQDTYVLNAGLGAMVFDADTDCLFIADRANARVIQFDTVGNAVVKYIACPPSPYDLLVRGGLLYVAAGTMTGVYDVATGVEIGTWSTIAGYGTRRVLYSTPDAVVLSDRSSSELVYVDPDTGAEMHRAYVEDLWFASGYARGALYASTGTPPTLTTSALNSASVEAGSTISVYQISAAVGRGFPAQLTID